MISGLDASTEQFLADLGRTQARMQNAQRQISSGLKFNDASDAPDQVSDILKLRADISRNSQVYSNLGAVKDQVNAAEQAVEAAVLLVERARALAAQGATGIQTAAGRLQIAQEVRSTHEQLAGLSASEIGGRFVFGGDADQIAPYSLDPLNPDAGGGVTALTTAPATRQIEDPSGNTFSVDLTAQQLFDHQNPDGTPAADNVFAAVNQLRVALEANDQAGVQNAIDALRKAGEYLNARLSFYGAAQNRIDAALELSDKLSIQFQSALADKQDADLAVAAVELTQSQLQQQATLEARAKVRKTSLFDYLG